MIRLFQFFILSLLSVFINTDRTFAQNENCNIEYNWAVNLNWKSVYYNKVDFINSDNNNSYIYEIDKKNEFINIFIISRDSGTLKSTIQIFLPSQYLESEIIGVSVVKTNVILLSSFINQKDNKTYYFRESFSLDTRKGIGDLKMIFEMPILKKDITTNFIKSKSRNYFAFIVYNYKGFNNIGSYAYVLDKEFNLSYSSNDLFNQIAGFSFIDEFYLTDIGSLHSIIRTFIDIEEVDRTRKVKVEYDFKNVYNINLHLQNYLYQICSIDKNRTTPTLTKILSPQEKFIKYLTIENIDSLCYLVGTFSNKNNLNDCGVFTYKLDLKNEYNEYLLINEYQSFENGFHDPYLTNVDKGLKNSALKEDSIGVWDYYNIINRGFCKYKNGYLCFLQKVIRVNYARKYNEYYPTIFYDYIYAIYYDKTGEIVKTFIIPMHQKETLNEIITYKEYRSSINVIDDKLFVIYNDFNPKYAVKDKYKKIVVLEYNEKLEYKTCEILIDDAIKYGIFTFDEWICNNKLLGFGYQKTKPWFLVFDIKNNH